MSFIAVNILKVLVLIGLFGFLAYIARSMRGHVVGPPVTERGSKTPLDLSSAPPAPMPTLHISTPDDGEDTYSLDKNLLIGRGSDANVQIDDEYASERHAFLTVEGSRIWLEDLGSTNGTIADGQQVDGKVEIARDSVLIVGRTKMVLR
jgi:hypothetical protein